MLLTRDTGVAGVVAHDVAARTITVRLCEWDHPEPVIDPDGTAYREQHSPGSIRLADPAHVVDRHMGVLIGRADPDSLRDDGTGPVVDLIVAPTSAGNDLLGLVDAGVIRSVSMELEPVAAQPPAGDLVVRTDSIVHGVAFAFRPQLSAPILATRGDRHEQDPNMDTATIRDTQPIPDPDPVVVQTVDQDTLARALDDLRREVIAVDHVPTGHPLARFRSLDDFATASWTDPTTAKLLSRALADQVTTDNPGVVPPGWLSEVFGIVDFGRPAINVMGVRPLPPAGMEVDWPYFDGDLLTLVGEQATQKTAITSVKVSLKKGSVPIRTWAGGSDLSYQLIRRSSPSYRDAYMRIMFAAYAAVTGNAASDALAATVGAQPLTYDGAADTDGSGLQAVLFEASTLVEAATGKAATFALAGTDVFIALGGKLIPAPYGTSNQVGTATASTLVVNVSGLVVTHDPYLAPATVIVSNRSAASWFEDGPFTVAAEDVEKLGQNVAVWGMGNFGAPVPSGIVKIAVTLPAGTQASRAKKS